MQEGDLEKLQRFVTVLGAEDLMVVSAVVTSADAEREEVLSALVQARQLALSFFLSSFDLI